MGSPTTSEKTHISNGIGNAPRASAKVYLAGRRLVGMRYPLVGDFRVYPQPTPINPLAIGSGAGESDAYEPSSAESLRHRGRGHPTA
jgi:hypothetical protein